MPIISISLSDDIYNDVQLAAKSMGYSGKSDLFRQSVTAFINSHYGKIIKPSVSYILSVSLVCKETQTHAIHELIHKHCSQGLRSQFHLCLSGHRCMEVFGIAGKGSDLLAMLAAMEALPTLEKMSVCFDR